MFVALRRSYRQSVSSWSSRACIWRISSRTASIRRRVAGTDSLTVAGTGPPGVRPATSASTPAKAALTRPISSSDTVRCLSSTVNVRKSATRWRTSASLADRRRANSASATSR